MVAPTTRMPREWAARIRARNPPMICPAVTAGVVMVPHPWAAWESQMSLDPSIKMTVRTPGWPRASRPNRVIPVSPKQGTPH